MILRLDIENYKSIEKMSLTFGEVNALIGKNGAGKTTLISAINIIKQIASGVNINEMIGEVAPFGEFFNCNMHSESSRFSVKIQTPERQAFIYSFAIAFRNKAHNDSRKAFLFESESLARVDSDDEKDQTLLFRRTFDNALTIEARIGERLEAVPLQIDSSVSVLSSYANEEVKAIADLLASYRVIWMNNTDHLMGSSPIVNSIHLDLNTIDGVAVDLYTNNRHAYKEAISTIERIIPGFSMPEIIRIERPHSTEQQSEGDLKPKRAANYLVNWSDSNYATDSSMSRASLSGGNSRVIFLILSIYNSRSSSCFVAEEIENGMHLSRISRLIDQLRMIVKNRKIQFCFTTHNHLILEDLLPKEVIYVSLGAHGSEYKKLSETKEYHMISSTLGREASSSEVVSSGMLF